MAIATRPVDEQLFVEAEGTTRLRGSRCAACGTTTFPVAAGCARCTGADMVEVALPDTGTLWSWTVQRFEPKSPYRGDGSWTPYGVGYVHLGDVIVETRLLGDAREGYRIGAPVRMRLVPAWTETDPDGVATVVTTYAFETVADDTVVPATAEEA